MNRWIISATFSFFFPKISHKYLPVTPTPFCGCLPNQTVRGRFWNGRSLFVVSISWLPFKKMSCVNRGILHITANNQASDFFSFSLYKISNMQISNFFFFLKDNTLIQIVHCSMDSHRSSSKSSLKETDLTDGAWISQVFL